MQIEKNKNLICVYGSLRKGLGNHRLLEKSEYIGEFNTPPVYNLYSLGFFPGLQENGTTSVKMEVYAVDDETAISVDYLEGYHEDREPTFYNKTTIETPFGEASIYLYVPDATGLQEVPEGDWKVYLQNKRRI